MPITTVDQAVAGALPPFEWQKSTGTMEAAGVWHSLAYAAGIPGAATAPAGGLNGLALTSKAGSMPWTNPASGNTHLHKLTMNCPVAGSLILYDRLWENSGLVVTTTTAQTLTSAAWPARDRNASTNGDGVMIGLEFSAAATNAGAISNATVSYTNSAGTSGRTATLASTPAIIPATPALGTFVPFLLQAGDIGVRSIQSVTLGTSLVTGTVHMVAYRRITEFGCAVPNIVNGVDLVTGGGPRLFNDSVPFLIFVPSATTAQTPNGIYQVTQG